MFDEGLSEILVRARGKEEIDDGEYREFVDRVREENRKFCWAKRALKVVSRGKGRIDDFYLFTYGKEVLERKK